MRLKACLFGVVVSAALAAPAFAQEIRQVKMIYSAVSGFASSFVAQEQGIFKKHNIDVDFQLTNNTGNSPAAVVSNSVQIAGTTMSTVLQAVDAGLDLVLFSGGGVYPLEGDILVARPGSGIQKPTDLKGKTVGVPGLNAFLHFMMVRHLRTNGVDPATVKFVEVGFVQSADALKSGQIDAFPAVAPFSSRIIQSGAGYEVANWLKDTPDGTLTVVYGATRLWANANKDLIAAFRKGLKEGTEVIKKDRDAYNVATAKYTKLPPPVVAAVPPPNLIVDMTPAQVKWWVDLAKEQGVIKSDIPADKLLFQP